ncbi:hypothetical protein BC628DRAFT_968043 [Trametes gibbosa]|nr:hypothetical protein BC628DRAFT_968043 [Trametes gibbosa]
MRFSRSPWRGLCSHLLRPSLEGTCVAVVLDDALSQFAAALGRPRTGRQGYTSPSSAHFMSLTPTSANTHTMSIPNSVDSYVKSLPMAELAGLCAESVLFGMFAILGSISLWILLYREHHRRGRSKVNLWMAGITVTMLALTTVHLAIDIQRALEGFMGTTPGGPPAFFSMASKPTFIAKPAIFTALTVIGDGFMMYRIFILWNRRLITITLPVLLVFGTILTGSLAAYSLSRNEGAIFAPAVTMQFLAFFALSLATNLVTTLLLLGRILWMARTSNSRKSLTSSIHWKIMKTVLCSEGIYSISLIVNIVIYLATSSALFTVMDMLPPIIVSGAIAESLSRRSSFI